ncbi:hypothetical protein ACC691_38920, partial [Rhizobium johnstonii]|uniref:hypothetical protein n=1 Tax=Rhizobium johnstonii TaxID=3019933 RepID=UPI003F9B5659
SLYRLGVLPVAWAMKNDVVWNTMAARFILNDEGIAPDRHPNPSPLINELVASWISSGRTAGTELLRHDVTRQAELWVALLLLSALLGAWV